MGPAIPLWGKPASMMSVFGIRGGCWKVFPRVPARVRRKVEMPNVRRLLSNEWMSGRGKRLRGSVVPAINAGVAVRSLV
jgi:hypothetical protein